VKLWPIIMDTSEIALWSAYDAGKDDLVLIDQQGGSPPTIVAAWKGIEKIFPADDADKQTLLDALDAHLVP